MIWVILQVSKISLWLCVIFLKLLQSLPRVFAFRHHKRYSKVPSISLFFFVSNPKINKIFSVSHSTDSCQGIVTSEHSVLGLIKLIQSWFKTFWSLMHWQIVLIHHHVDEIFRLFFINAFLPDTKDVNPTTLIVRSSEGDLVMPVPLAIIKWHQTTFFKDMVRSNNFDNLRMTRNTFIISLFHHFIKLLLVLKLIVFFGLHWGKFSSGFLFWKPRWILGSSLEWNFKICSHFPWICFSHVAFLFFGFDFGCFQCLWNNDWLVECLSRVRYFWFLCIFNFYFNYRLYCGIHLFISLLFILGNKISH